MAIQLTKIPMAVYKPITVNQTRTRTYSGNVVAFDRSRESASKVAFKATLDKAQISQKFWDDLLEKLRKAGGGGGGGSFDRIKVSMQLMDFISNKMIRALLENMKMGIPLPENISQNQVKNQNPVSVFLQVVTNNLMKMVTLFASGKDLPLASLYNRLTQNLTKGVESLFIAFSLQMNKLKETLKKANIKAKLKAAINRGFTVLFDFFVEMKEEVKNIIYFVKNFLNLEVSDFANNDAKIYVVKR
jgi:hypothetical protein